MKKLFNWILIKLGIKKSVNINEFKKSILFSQFMELNVLPDSDLSFNDYLIKYFNQNDK